MVDEKSGTRKEIEGKMGQAGGKVKEELGDVTGNTRQEAEGRVQQHEGKTRETEGKLQKKME
jgi:uncharacterized protein YjbJ (UPF0337 family)